MDNSLSPWKRSQFNLLPNPDAERSLVYSEKLRDIISKENCQEAHQEIQSWPGYEVSELISLPHLANILNLVDISFKDESKRFGLGSFKSLGGAYAVFKHIQSIVEKRTGLQIDSDILRSEKYKEITSQITVTTATDGNHGRSVAWGAQLFGCSAVIYVPSSCSKERIEAIREFGAQVIQSNLNYDDTVRLCAETGHKEGHQVISDTSWADYTKIPSQVMQGYSLIAEEAIIEYFTRSFREAVPPSHIFIQAGVGGLAAAITGYLWDLLDYKRPVIVIVEPENAACLFASAAEGTLTKASGDKDTGEIHTIMAGLDCGEASPIAWDILSKGADFFMTVPDDITAPSMQLLANSPFGDPTITAGESSVAGLAALIMTASHEESRQTLGLSPDSRILLVNSEGAMDKALYHKLVVEELSG
ncbi:diaminopropionate ammonia-lyase [Kiloniella sp.]|uniref:diaminopropionate ammonia-lyase n=1 Tax=Kiloniella sp. TaxID=1938587 RepID=UPI003B01F6A5